jgi:hypothetical protein
LDISDKVENYLKASFGPTVKLEEIEQFGEVEGVHVTTAYRMRYSTPEIEDRLIINTLFPLLNYNTVFEYSSSKFGISSFSHT